jgi:hypothetical protein
MYIDVQKMRNAHVLRVCSADSNVVICGSDSSELLIILLPSELGCIPVRLYCEDIDYHFKFTAYKIRIELTQPKPFH